ncbi:MAG TPA: hypothetical protein VNA57_02105 [Acidimicrobiales bacterium]|nr:hypothetical protein [Acidimicrobiales bacterium]
MDNQQVPGDREKTGGPQVAPEQDRRVEDTMYRQLGRTLRSSSDTPPPDTIYTASIETIDNDLATALLPGGFGF